MTPFSDDALLFDPARLQVDVASKHASAARLPDTASLRGELVGEPRVPDGGDRIAPWASFSIAILIHCAVFAVIALGPSSQELSGAGGQQLEAIEVSLVQSTVLESRERKQTDAATAAPLPVAPEDGENSKIDAQQQVLSAKPQAREEQPEPEQPDADAPPVPENPATPAEPQSRGGAAATGGEDSRPTSGAAAASPGIMSRYAAEVRAVLAHNKPDGRGRRGTATVTFTISPAGKVRAARITGSSGYSDLDHVTLAAIERSSFPTPPNGMSERDLTYVIPFRFR